MSKVLALKVSAGNDSPRWWRVRSITTKTRRIVVLSLALLIVVCLSAIGSMRVQSTEVDYLILTIDPVIDIGAEIYREMTVAQSELLRYQVTRQPEQLLSYRAEKMRIETALVQLHTDMTVLTDRSDSEVVSQLANLETIHRDAAERWLAYASFIEQAALVGKTTVSTTEVALFQGFRQANTMLDEILKSERNRARTRTRTASDRGTTVVIVAALMVSAVALIFGLRLARIVSKPLVDLSDTMKRHREGDFDARAHENRNSVETRDLVHGFNLLSERESELQRIQSRALSMHDLTVRIEHAIRIAPNTQQALEILCVGLGEGLGVDRVLANTVNAELKPMLGAQWHLSDLPPLGDLPDELIPYINKAAEELWGSSGHLVAYDRLAPETQSERAKAFYRYTGARAVIVVPVGVGDQVIGMIYVVTTLEPRQWADSEINAVKRVAAFLAQFVVEQTYRDQLNEHIERLEQLNRQKDNFVATVSHELRTPLTSIIGYLEVLQDGFAGDLTVEQTRMLDVMDRNAGRLMGLIQDLLALNKHESEVGDVEMVNVSMPELVTSVCDDLSPLAESGAIKIDCDAGPERAVVQGDRGKLQSAVANIVSNAIKFSRRGGVVTIGCTLDETNRRVQFTCQDRGIGIPAADQGELFTRFHRASNAMTRFIPGTGLGLTIVKQIVDDHGGVVRLDSVEGEGTTVVIDLPLSPQDSF